jgi:hypothetical protein
LNAISQLSLLSFHFINKATATFLIDMFFYLIPPFTEYVDNWFHYFYFCSLKNNSVNIIIYAVISSFLQFFCVLIPSYKYFKIPYICVLIKEGEMVLVKKGSFLKESLSMKISNNLCLQKHFTPQILISQMTHKIGPVVRQFVWK